jgi:uncharacterized protein YqeY
VVSVRDSLQNDLKASLKQGDKVKSGVIRFIMSNVHNAEIAQQREFGDEDITGVIGKLAKSCRESIEAFEKGNRPDLVAEEKAQLAVIATYLPEQLSHDEIVALAKKAIEETGASSRSDMGKVMGKLMPQVKGKADGKEVNAVIMELLS